MCLFALLASEVVVVGRIHSAFLAEWRCHAFVASIPVHPCATAVALPVGRYAINEPPSSKRCTLPAIDARVYDPARLQFEDFFD
jgi:hypothetical protein